MEVVHSGAGSLTSHIPVTQPLICLGLWPTCLGGPWPGALPRGIPQGNPGHLSCLPRLLFSLRWAQKIPAFHPL